MVDAAQSTCTKSQHLHKFCLTIASHMPGDGGNTQTQNLEHSLLGFQTMLRLGSQGANRSCHLPYKDPVIHGFHTLDVTTQLICPNSSFITKCDRNGVHYMGAACHGHIPVFLDKFQDALLASFQIPEDNIVSITLKKYQSRVHDILTGSSPVNILAGIIRQDCLESLQQWHDSNGAFIELANGRNVNKFSLSVFIDNIGLFFRNNPQLCLSCGQSSFRIQPFLYPGLVAENLPHFVGTEQETVNLTVNYCRWHDIKPLSLSLAAVFQLS